MKFYIVMINDVPGCVINDQMTDADIQSAIEQELDCLGCELETVAVERSTHTLGSKVPGELVVVGSKHEYNTTPITVHGIEKVVTYQHKDKFLFDFVNSSGIADVGHVAQGLGIEHERLEHWEGELPTIGTQKMPVWPKTHLTVTVFDKL